MSYPTATDFSQTLTIAKDASTSGVLDLGYKKCVGFVVPHAVEATTAQLSFLSCTTIGGTFLPVYRGGTKLVLPIAIDEWAFLEDMNDLYGARFLKISAETSGGVAVVQSTASRVFTAICLDNL